MKADNMADRVFSAFETLVDPYPLGEPGTPPRGLLPFLLHFSRPVLFENIGTVQDGINTIARSPAVQDRPDAVELRVPHGEIRFETLRFDYAGHAGERVHVFEGLSLTIAPGEKVG